MCLQCGHHSVSISTLEQSGNYYVGVYTVPLRWRVSVWLLTDTEGQRVGGTAPESSKIEITNRVRFRCL